MSVSTATGSKAYIAGQHAIATDTAAEYAALTWVEIKEVESLGEFGDEGNAVTFASLGDARARKLKGIRDAGTMALMVGRDPLDPGQLAARAAEKTKFNYDFKIVAADAVSDLYTNSIFYFAGIVMSARDNFGANDNVVKTAFNIAINTPIVEVPSVLI